jgi:tetratricopeptide (TPR) repeat protein
MSRLTKYRIGVAVLVVMYVAAGVLAIRSIGNLWLGLVIVGLLFVVPGRVQGVLWRDFFRGSRLLRLNRNAEAVPYLEGFIERLEHRPALAHAMWLQWPGYTPSAMAMGLNNLAVAYLDAGETEKAIPLFLDALRVDRDMSVAWWNLATAYDRRGETEAALNASAEARRLGYRGGTLDSFQQCAAGALTRVEGRGA